MKKILILLIIFIISSCDVSIVEFDDINDYKGNIVLEIEKDSVGTIETRKIYIIDTLEGSYDIIIIRPEFVKFLKEGDII